METTEMHVVISQMSQELGNQWLHNAKAWGQAWGKLCDAEVAEWLRLLGLQTVQHMVETTVADAVAQHRAAGVSIKHTPTIRYNTIFGPLHLESPYLWHAEYGSAKPLRELGMTHDGRSEAVERALSDFGSEHSFERAADRFAEHYHYHLSHSTADRVTKQAGHDAQAYLAQRLQAQDGAGDPADTVLVECDGCAIRTGTFLAPDSPPPATISIGEAALTPDPVDPTVPSLLGAGPRQDTPRQKTIQWTEVRVGVARPLQEDRAAEKLFVGNVASYPDIIADIKQTAGLVGLTDTSQVVAVADGANGWREEFERQFTAWEFQFILDTQHLNDHLYAVAEALDVEAGDRAEWIAPSVTRLSAGALDDVMAELTGLFEQTGEAKIDTFMGYLERFGDAVCDDAFRRAGYPVGSGEVESAHKSLPQQRLKLPGACWHPDSLNPMMALRVVRANGWWDDFWEDRTTQLLAA
jgi:hypothetical protein